jgi:hypothetical protein
MSAHGLHCAQTGGFYPRRLLEPVRQDDFCRFAVDLHRVAAAKRADLVIASPATAAERDELLARQTATDPDGCHALPPRQYSTPCEGEESPWIIAPLFPRYC